MKISEILTQEEMEKLDGMKEYAIPIWAINNMLRNHWKDLTIDQWIELEKLYEISGLGDTIADQTERTSKQLKKIRNTMEEINE